MSSLARRNIAALGFCVFCCDAVRILDAGLRNAAKTSQEQRSTLNLELENNLTAGPPKEDCSMYDLDLHSYADTTGIKEAILKQIPELCQGGINQGYADHSVSTGRIIVALQLQVSPRADKEWWQRAADYKICGFTSLKFRPASVHVDLICSHMGYGGLLLRKAEATAVKMSKPHVDLDSVPLARKFYEKQGYKHCGDPCDSKRCIEKHNIINDLFVMKKCASKAAANEKPVAIKSSGVKSRKDITKFFERGGAKDEKTFTWKGKTYRCCCSVVNLCHLVVEGRDKLPIFWQTGWSGCGKYVEHSHSWNFPEWGSEGRCVIESDSLTYQDFKAVNAQIRVGDAVKINWPAGPAGTSSVNGKIGEVFYIDEEASTCRLHADGVNPNYDFPLAKIEYMFTFKNKATMANVLGM